MTPLATKIRDARLAMREDGKPVPQTEVARRAGIARQTYRNLEDGSTRNVDAETLRKVAPVLGIKAEELTQLLLDSGTVQEQTRTPAWFLGETNARVQALTGFLSDHLQTIINTEAKRLAEEELTQALMRLHDEEPELAAQVGTALRRLLRLPPAPEVGGAKSPAGQAPAGHQPPASPVRLVSTSPTPATQGRRRPRTDTSA